MSEEKEMRVNKYLATQQICSRREADVLLKEGRVLIDGKKAVLGQKVLPGSKVQVLGQRKELFYVVYNKPVGIVTNCPQVGEQAIADVLKLPFTYFPVGRLDKDSFGLILLTNDGRVTDKLLNPKYYHEKEYIVTVNRILQLEDLQQMRQGVVLDDGIITKKCKIKHLSEYSFSVILTEGKNRQIRRMCKSLGYKVMDLCRVRIMNIELQGLHAGKYRFVTKKELTALLHSLGIK